MLYNNKPPLRQFCGFVFITPELHTEFDTFRSEHTSMERSLLRHVALLRFWNERRAIPSSVISKFGNSYLNLTTSEVDELCRWVYDTREKGFFALNDGDMNSVMACAGKYRPCTIFRHACIHTCKAYNIASYTYV